MSLKTRTFLFQNSGGNFYSIVLDGEAGTGLAYLIGPNGSADFRKIGVTPTALEFDPAVVDGRHESFFHHAPIFGPAGDTALKDILTD